MNKKLKNLCGLNVQEVQTKERKKKKVFCKLESLFFFLLVFNNPLPLHLKDDF
jgi:hypothetical protein